MSETRLSVADLRARLAGAQAAQVEAEVTQAPVVFATQQPGVVPGFRKGAQAAEATAPAPRQASGKRANKYGAKCVKCATWVPAEQGYLAKTAEGKWAAECITCPVTGGWLGDPREGDHYGDPDPVAQAVVAQEVEVPPGFVKITAITGQTYVGLQPGTYTLETARGHRTFRIRVQGTEEDFAPGKTILEYLSGSDNQRDYTSFAFVNGTRLAVWKKHQGNEALVADAKEFLADPSKALLAATCIRCNALLSTPESITALMGPTCREKGW